MSDSVDRVFVKAITTIRALSSRSNYGSLPRPPAENRIKLYGLYKQAVEGNVENVMPRPVGFSLEDEGAKKKWDAWKREQGLGRTEAKRQYISYLIETMRVYASGTLEARELLGELEYLWDQIKDLKFAEDDDHDAQGFYRSQAAGGAPGGGTYPSFRMPSHSPLFSQSDRYSVGTPLPLPSNYSASVVGGAGAAPSSTLHQYKTNLQKIYSHSRRGTTLAINDYVQQQRQHHRAASVYSAQSQPAPSGTGAGAGVDAAGIPEELKAWQGEVTNIINKLSREFLASKSSSKNTYGAARGINSSRDDEEEYLDISEEANDIIPRRIVHILRIIGVQALKFLKNFSISLLTILFVTWCIKRNVIVERTVVNQPLQNKKNNKELVINMVLNMDENKWFLRMLSFINSFVGFV